jgi:hypothetical protein
VAEGDRGIKGCCGVNLNESDQMEDLGTHNIISKQGLMKARKAETGLIWLRIEASDSPL